MPLVIITGHPCSGKTHRAQQIQADFQARAATSNSARAANHIPTGLTVLHIQSFHSSLDPTDLKSELKESTSSSINPRDLIYSSAREEKTARAEEFSTVKRALSKNSIAIADGLNYIKGFRYQLWCEAKAVGTRSVVVHVAARQDECEDWNQTRLKAWQWDHLLQHNGEDGNENVGSTNGKDAIGGLQPESHTAIYGDKVLYDTPKSRSSSTDGMTGGDDKQDLDERMTLKSLYISGDKEITNMNMAEANEVSNASNLRTQENGQGISTAATAEPPPPESSLPYAPATLKALSMRYEPPSPFTRWDTPLFTVPTADEHPPYQAIWDALFPPPIKPTKKVLSQLRPGEQTEARPEEVRRHAATVLPKATNADALQTLETATADVVKNLLSSARDNGITSGEGGCLTFVVPDPKNENEVKVNVEVPLNTMLSQPALQRLRRKYTQIQRGGIAHGQGHMNGRTEVVRDFSRFLQAEWEAE